MSETKEKKVKNYDEIEAALVAKYPHAVVGTLLPAGVAEGFAGKMTIEIACVDCGAHRRIATQDLFQVFRCKACTKIAQKANRRTKRAADPVLSARKAEYDEKMAGFAAARAAKVAEKETKARAKAEEAKRKLDAAHKSLQDRLDRLNGVEKQTISSEDVGTVEGVLGIGEAS